MSFLFWLRSVFGFTIVPEKQVDVLVQDEITETYVCENSGYTMTDSLHANSLQNAQNTWAMLKDTPYDFVSDDSLWKYVGPKVGLSNTAYVPPGLVSIENIDYVDVRNNEGKLRKEAASALADLSRAFHQEFGRSLVIVSSYRGYLYQKKLLAGYSARMGTGRAQGMSAFPGHSEHQLGLAMDIFNTSSDGGVYQNYFSWMRAHAHEYGRTQSYQKGAKVDGYIVEPWHWRYVGIELATYLWKHKMTFSEYVHQ